MRLIFSLIVVLNIFFLSGKAQSAKIKNDVNYTLDALFIGGQKNLAVKDKAIIIFDLKKKTAKCLIACNYIDLKYSSKSNKFKFTYVVPGPVPCPDHLIGLESDLKENLAKVNSFQLSNNKIYFFNKKDTLLILHEQ